MPLKNRTNKRKIRKSLKTRRRKQKGGGAGWFKSAPINAPPIRPSNGPILPEDILFQDADVCILKPGVKKGILIFTNYTQPAGTPPLCEAGLKTGERLRSEKLSFVGSNLPGRKIHPYIFFRAPFKSTEIDYTSVDDEIESVFGESALAETGCVWIRVDPAQTYVYSSEIRALYKGDDLDAELHKSRMKMTDFLQQQAYNKEVTQSPGNRFVTNLYSYRVFTEPFKIPISYPIIESNIISAEVLVRVPHLTPNYFVKCAPAPPPPPPAQTFVGEWCNKNGDIIGYCPICRKTTTFDSNRIYHKATCTNRGKEIDLTEKPKTTESLAVCS